VTLAFAVTTTSDGPDHYLLNLHVLKFHLLNGRLKPLNLHHVNLHLHPRPLFLDQQSIDSVKLDNSAKIC